jgi:ribosomal protein L18E
MPARGRTLGSVNVKSEKPFGEALRMELAAAGDSHRELRLIARNLITLARAGEAGSLQAIREIADRLDGKPKSEAEVSLGTAIARELTDDDLAAIAVGAAIGDQENQANKEQSAVQNPTSGKSKLN